MLTDVGTIWYRSRGSVFYRNTGRRLGAHALAGQSTHLPTGVSYAVVLLIIANTFKGCNRDIYYGLSGLRQHHRVEGNDTK
jgi:hypothetical protein